MKKSYTRKELKAICNALNKIFWENWGQMDDRHRDDVADQWVLELQEINIDLKWNRLGGEMRTKEDFK
jgi:hypothetical protein